MSTADDAWNEWALHQLRYNLDDQRPAFMAGAAWALEDAADELPLDYRDHPPMVWLRGESGTGFDVYVSDWLRDRAAGVGTKDGDDDE